MKQLFGIFMIVGMFMMGSAGAFMAIYYIFHFLMTFRTGY